jgi:protein SCO1/2
MKDNMVILQEKIKNLKNVMLLSHTVMPDIDSVSVLKAYAQKKGVDDNKWHLVTGDKKDIFYIEIVIFINSSLINHSKHFIYIPFHSC